jgi:hypothetical protein
MANRSVSLLVIAVVATESGPPAQAGEGINRLGMMGSPPRVSLHAVRTPLARDFIRPKNVEERWSS